MSGFDDELIQTLHKDVDLAEDRIEAALERQVVSGLPLSTVLLEMALVEEAPLAMALEKATGLPPLTGRALKNADPEAISAFPKRLAAKHRMVPVSLEGRRMVVAVSKPPDLNLVEEIEFMLSVYVTPHIVNDVRLSEALFRFYDVDLGPTPKGILAMWGEDPEEEKASAQAAEEPETPFEMPTTQERVEEAAEAERALKAQAEANDGGAQDVWSVQGAPHVTVDPPVADAEAEPDPASGDERAPATPASSLLAGDVTREEIKEKLLQKVDAEEQEALDAAARRHRDRVLWTVDDAIAELALADDRDGLVDVVLRFAHRRLDTAAMFVVERRGEEPHFVGWDVIDQNITRDAVTKMNVPAKGDNAFAKVFEMRSPFLGPLTEEDDVVRAMGRLPRAVLLMPVFVGTKLAAVLYGDNGKNSVPPTSLAELHMVVPRFGKALRNLILRKKGAVTGQTVQPERIEPATPAAKVTASIPVIDIEEDPSGPQPVASGAHGERQPGPPPPSDARGVYIKTRPPRGRRSYEKPPPLPKRKKPRPPDIAIPTPETPVDPTPAAAEEPVVPPTADAPAAEPPPAAAEAPTLTLVEGGAEGSGHEPLSENVSADTIPIAMGQPDAEATHEPALELVQDEEAGPSTMELAAGLYEQAKAEDDFSLDVDVEPAPPRATVVPSPGADAKASLLLATYRSWVGTLDDETDAQVIDLQAEGEAGRAAIGRFVRMGDRAMPTLARYFPGALRRDPFGQMDSRPEVEDFSDALACLTRMGRDQAAPILLAGCDHDDRRHRYAAVWGLSDLVVPAAVPKLVERIFDPELRIALLALDVLPAYRDAPLFEKALAQLRQLCRGGETEFHRRRAIMGVAELKDTAALEVLVEFVGTKPKDVADEAHRALVHLTKQDFGSSSRRWRAWIADHKDTQRTAWLIQGLLHKDERIRESAQAELNRLTGNYLSYRYDAPRAERDAAVAKWKSWWADEDKTAWP